MSRKIAESLRAAILLSFFFMVQGCSGTQLEDRCFPMLAAVDEEDGLVEFTYGFPELSQKDNTDLQEARVNAPKTSTTSFEESLTAYEKALSKKPDCSHLKVLVLSEHFLRDRQALEEMLVFLEETQKFPRNTYVCTTEDVAALLDTEEQLPQDLGTYLEIYLQNHESDQKIRRMTLGRLMDAQKNRKGLVEIPVLAVRDGAIVLTGEYN